jgi:nucleoside-diphosphate-sugar epimerase
MGKTLVTGATGFTGSHICRRLITEGRQVVAFARDPDKIRELESSGVECRLLEITDPVQVKDHFSDIDTVFHLAAAYRTEHADRGKFWRVNVKATGNLLDAAKSARVKRFIHCSTVGVQGRIDHPPADEHYRMQPGDHYQRSKAEGELMARRYFADGLPGTIVRPVGIYGPGDSRFLKLFRPIYRGYFVMIGSGGTLYHLTFIDDLVSGLVLCGRHPAAVGEVFTIAGESHTTITALVNQIADVLEKARPRWRVPFGPVFAVSVACEKACGLIGATPPLYPRRVEFFHIDRAFTIAKAKRLIGYRPTTSLREGLLKTASWYREQGLL